MRQATFNVYFTVSLLFIVFTVVAAVLDQNRVLIDNTVFLSVLLLSLLNFIYSLYLFFKVPAK